LTRRTAYLQNMYNETVRVSANLILDGIILTRQAMRYPLNAHRKGKSTTTSGSSRADLQNLNPPLKLMNETEKLLP
jgi:hypothetical protein